MGSARILVVQTAYVGDVVLTTPLLRELHRGHPEARITMVTTESGRQLLEGLPHLHRLIALDKGWGGKSWRSFAGTLLQLAQERFDIAIAAQRSLRTGQLLLASAAPLRVGFAGAPGAWAYHRRVPWCADKHAVWRYLDLAACAGCDASTADPRPELRVDPAAASRVAELLREGGLAAGGRFLCVAPGSIRATKRWLPAGFARLIADSAGRGLPAVLVGTAEERQLCSDVAAAARCGPLVLAGRTSIPELVALISRASAVVANDSGAAHVASAVGTPVVSIFGPTSPAAGYRPFTAASRVVEHPNLACRPCSRRGSPRCPLGHFRCMRELPAEAVIERLVELLPAAEPAAAVVA